VPLLALYFPAVSLSMASLEGHVVCDGTGGPRLEVSRWKASWSATELAGPVSM
jgi:hypothetical protein